jgi:hypothetical protein
MSLGYHQQYHWRFLAGARNEESQRVYSFITLIDFLKSLL